MVVRRWLLLLDFGEAWDSVTSDYSVSPADYSESEFTQRAFWSVLQRTGHWDAATRMLSCFWDAELGFDCANEDCDYTHYVNYHCDNRVCPNCGEARAARTFNNFHERVVSRLDVDKLRFTTLTFRNFEELTEERLEAARECFHRLRRREVWQQEGGLYAFECPYDEESGEWNLHVHVLTEGPRMRIGPDSGMCTNPGEHDVEECMRCAWKEITRRVEGAPMSHILDVRNMGEVCSNNVEVANYLTKYLTKSPDLFEGSELSLRERVKALYQYHDTFHNANMIQTFGHCHHASNRAVSLRWNPDGEFECPECEQVGGWELREGVIVNNVQQTWRRLKAYTGFSHR